MRDNTYREIRKAIGEIRTQNDADRVGEALTSHPAEDEDVRSLGESYCMVCEGLSLTSFRTFPQK